MSENLITKEMLVELSTNFKSLVETYKKFRLFKNRKSLSEDMSGLLETIVSDYYDNSKPAKGDDNKPDVTLFTPYKNYGNIIEIKSTTTNTLRGGKLSKRPGYYVLLSWQMFPETYFCNDITLKLFCAGIYLTENDWDKKELDENTKYYATSYPFKKILNNEHEIYYGNIYSGRKTQLIYNEI